MPDREIIPVLLGADLNCYNVARAFHMKYGVISNAFGRYAVSATKYSRIVDSQMNTKARNSCCSDAPTTMPP